MELRIYRTYTWELDCPRSEVKFGGTNPMKLVAHDELQYRGSCHLKDDWLPLPIVEGVKPKHPDDFNKQAVSSAVLESIDKIKKVNVKVKRLIC
jgi:hypothetical protein